MLDPDPGPDYSQCGSTTPSNNKIKILTKYDITRALYDKMTLKISVNFVHSKKPGCVQCCRSGSADGSGSEDI
jgi:hypothetical protein